MAGVACDLMGEPCVAPVRQHEVLGHAIELVLMANVAEAVANALRRDVEEGAVVVAQALRAARALARASVRARPRSLARSRARGRLQTEGRVAVLARTAGAEGQPVERPGLWERAAAA